MQYAVVMNLLLQSLMRALGNCLHGKVIAWTLFPLALMGLMAVLLSWLYWDPAVAWAMQLLAGVTWLQPLWNWLHQQGVVWGMNVLAAILVVIAAAPLLIALVLLLVSLFMTPPLVKWVAQSRFPLLERKQGASWAQGLVWSLGSTCIAIVLLLLSMPLWLIPPLVLVLPPLVWGWLTYRVMAFDALADHASKAERQALFARYRMQLLLIGMVCGMLGAAPSIVWASGVVFLALAWLLVPIAIWIYAFVFALSSLWFAHFCLSALEQLRAESKDVSSTALDPLSKGV